MYFHAFQSCSAKFSLNWHGVGVRVRLVHPPAFKRTSIEVSVLKWRTTRYNRGLFTGPGACFRKSTFPGMCLLQRFQIFQSAFAVASRTSVCPQLLLFHDWVTYHQLLIYLAERFFTVNARRAKTTCWKRGNRLDVRARASPFEPNVSDQSRLTWRKYVSTLGRNEKLNINTHPCTIVKPGWQAER